jgi:hypothetical protein
VILGRYGRLGEVFGVKNVVYLSRMIFGRIKM